MNKKELGALAINLEGYKYILGQILCDMENNGNKDTQVEKLLKVIEGLDLMIGYLGK